MIESFGGAGYVEDTGLPQLLRDAQVLPIWEGTTNVLSLDALLRSDLQAGLAALMGRVSGCVRPLSEPRLAAAGRQAVGAVERAALWLQSGHDRDVLQASARRLAMTLARRCSSRCCASTRSGCLCTRATDAGSPPRCATRGCRWT